MPSAGPDGDVSFLPQRLDFSESPLEIGQYRFVQWARNRFHGVSTFERSIHRHSINFVSVGSRPKVAAITIEMIDDVVVFLHECLAIENLLTLVFDFGRPDVVPVTESIFGHLEPRVHSIGRSEERRVGKECRSRWSP